MIPMLLLDEVEIDEELVEEEHVLRSHRLGEEKIAGFVDDKAALRQRIMHVLSTERYAYGIYGDDYGVELEQYQSQSFEFLEATIENTLSDALLQDEDITGISIISIEQLNFESALIVFDVYSPIGDIEGMEVTINA